MPVIGRAAEYIGRSAKLLEATDEDSAAERYVYVAKVRCTVLGFLFPLSLCISLTLSPSVCLSLSLYVSLS